MFKNLGFNINDWWVRTSIKPSNVAAASRPNVFIFWILVWVIELPKESYVCVLESQPMQCELSNLFHHPNSQSDKNNYSFFFNAKTNEKKLLEYKHHLRLRLSCFYYIFFWVQFLYMSMYVYTYHNRTTSQGEWSFSFNNKISPTAKSRE